MRAESSRQIVIAPDSFKGSLSASDVAEALRAGWMSVCPDDQIVLLPQADGGEGTLEAIAAAHGDATRHRVPGITGPDGREVVGEWLELTDGTGVVELAQMSGLPLMATPDALGATSRGLGDVMAAMLDAGVTRMLIGLGGSASTDAGLPILEALGDRQPPRDGAVLLTDVRSPLLGPEGAAAVFAPQKGANAEQVRQLEQRLERAVALLGGDPTEPGAGAAGGVGFGLRHWGATIQPGAEFIANLTGLPEALASAAAVVTGEGRYDGQSLSGKIVGHILQQAKLVATPIGVVAGSFLIEPECWHASLVELAGSFDSAVANPSLWLERAGALAARDGLR